MSGGGGTQHQICESTNNNKVCKKAVIGHAHTQVELCIWCALNTIGVSDVLHN